MKYHLLLPGLAAFLVCMLFSAGAVSGLPISAGTSTGAGAHGDSSGTRAPGSNTVGYLAFSSHWTGEDSAAIGWLSSDSNFVVKTLDLDGGLPDLDGADVLWIHIPDSADYTRWIPRLKQLRGLKSWYDNGGRFLFTGLAAVIPVAVGIETAPPAIEAADIEDDWLFDQKGFQGFRPSIFRADGAHPLFNELFGGTFTWDGDANHRLWTAGYFGAQHPAVGKVVAVEKAYITISAERRLVIEYDNAKGRGITIGGFVFFHRHNHRRRNMERFLENSLLYLAGGPAAAGRTYWTSSDVKPVRVDAPTPDQADNRTGRGGTGGAGTGGTGKAGAGGRDIHNPDADRVWSSSSGLLIARDSATQNFFDVAGRRALVMGNERGGIDELWVHPFRVLRDYRAGIVNGDSILWLNQLSPRIEIRPESFIRVYTTPFGTVKEVVFAALDAPAAVVRYQFTGPGRIRLAVKFCSDLRIMWPYDSPATGSLHYGDDTTGGVLSVSDGTGDIHILVGADMVPSQSLSGQFDSVGWSGAGFTGRATDANQVYHGAIYEIDPVSRPSLTIAIAGTDEGPDSALQQYRTLLADPAAAYGGMVRHYRELLGSMVTVESPDPEFNDLFKWTLVGADRFVATTPGIGTGLLAGYATTARGWDGAQKISGRPGYGWYFGRDAEWSGFAIDDYGDTRAVRRQLGLLQRYQDPSGKIFHEISTSGSVHDDAADATPLYVILAAHYLRASGDTGFIRESWPKISLAVEYLYSTDTDGDLLIENTNQGHGWVEGGNLYPVHTEFYLAGAWCRALLDASTIASILGRNEQAEKYGRDGGKVKEILNRDFWNDETRFFNFGKLAAGGFNPEPTVLPATVMYYGLLDDAKVRPVLEQYAGAGFSSDWGVRIVSSSSKLFNPQGYHYGSVWPLFTGWTALAEYEYGNSTQGFTHILNNMYIKNHWALGFVEEVMNGSVYRPSGVCPHQCWSETNILHPAITGMVGWKPDAVDHSAGLSPRFPAHWDSVKVNRLRVGDRLIDFSMIRNERKTVWTFATAGGSPVTVHFAPELPEGMTITRVTLDGRDLPPPAGRRRALIDPPIDITPGRSGAKLVFEHTGGIGVVPPGPRPEPGDSSTGHRIVSASLEGDVYSIVLDGKPGTTAAVELRTFGVSVGGADNATVRRGSVANSSLVEVKFPGSALPYVRTIVKVHTVKN